MENAAAHFGWAEKAERLPMILEAKSISGVLLCHYSPIRIACARVDGKPLDNLPGSDVHRCGTVAGGA
jgi:hypothetical protein